MLSRNEINIRFSVDPLTNVVYAVRDVTSYKSSKFLERDHCKTRRSASQTRYFFDFCR